MTLRSKLVRTLIGALLAINGPIDAAEPELKVTISEPTESDAVPIQTRLKTKEKIRKKFGEPERTKTLGESDAPCVERWFYSGDVDLGFGSMKMLLYVDFDASEKVCKK